MVKKLLLTVLFISILTITGTAKAQDKSATDSATPLIEVKYAGVNPSDSYRYTLKRLQENILLKIYSFFPQKKLSYSENLLDTRLAELKYIVDKKDIANIETTSQRYAATAGNLTEDAKNASDQMKMQIKKMLTDHLAFINNLKSSYNDTTAEWRFVENDVNSLKEYISKL